MGDLLELGNKRRFTGHIVVGNEHDRSFGLPERILDGPRVNRSARLAALN